MRRLRAFLVRLAGAAVRGRKEREMAEELACHLEMETEANIRGGMPPEQARRAALLKAGGLEPAKEACRDGRRIPFVETVLRDFAFALRHWRRNPGFAAFVILISALGIGSIAFMFAVLWNVALKPLPFPDPDRLVLAEARTAAGRRNSVSALDYFDYRTQCGAFDSLAARSVWLPGRAVTGKNEPELVRSNKVSANFFATLGVRPLLGRTFSETEEEPGAPKVVVVSEAFWERRLDARRDLAALRVTADGEIYQVAGVMPRSFDFPAGVEMWFPLSRGGREESGRGNNNFTMIGRLAAGATPAGALSQMEVVAARISKEHPKEKGGWGARVVLLDEQLLGDVRPGMYLLTGATALVLLILCANLSSLLLARGMARRGEFSLRRSLGASAASLTRQLLIESLVLVASGAAAGSGLALLGIRALKTLGPANLPRLASVALDPLVLAVIAGAALVTVALSGVAPALQGARLDLRANLQEGARSAGSPAHLAARRSLVAAQLALSLVLLALTGLLVRSLTRLQSVDPGLRAGKVLTLDVQIPGQDSNAQSERYFRVLERLRALPGVERAAGADQIPFFGGPYNGVYRADRPPTSSSGFVPATRRIVTDDFFETLGVPLLAGRGFLPGDRRGAPSVTVVSQSLARALFGAESPLGRVMVLPWGKGLPLEIVGVAGDVRDFGLAVDLRPAFYLALRQMPGAPASLRFVVRGAGQATALAQPVRQAVRELEKDAVLHRVSTMERWVSDSTAGQRFSSLALGIFTGVAMLLAAAGLFGLMSYVVTQRRHEIGVRLALGAPASSVLRLVVRQGVALALIGTAAGIPLTIWAARLAAAQLYATSPADPAAIGGAALALAAVALLASLGPAWRAARTDCVAALRAD